jgi:hypothetical protein
MNDRRSPRFSDENLLHSLRLSPVGRPRGGSVTFYFHKLVKAMQIRTTLCTKDHVKGKTENNYQNNFRKNFANLNFPDPGMF